MMTDPRESKLPKWVQDTLAGLRRELATERKRVAMLKYEVGETDTRIRDYSNLKDLPLPKGSVVAFDMPEGDYPTRQQVQVYITERGTLHVQGDYGLVIHPRASNSFDIAIERYR
jgi:hypothetical protein